MGVVVSFLALMELSREHLVDIVQNEPMGRIYVKARALKNIRGVTRHERNRTRHTRPAQRAAAGLGRHALKHILEAALLAAGEPLTMTQLGELFDEDQRPGGSDIGRALEELAADCVDRGIELQEVANGFRYQVSRKCTTGWRGCGTETPGSAIHAPCWKHWL